MKLVDLISSGQIILMDGATGTELDKHGLMSREDANLTAPEVVMSVHSDYIRAGSQIITANTLTMNRIYMETHSITVDVGAINRAGVELARKAAGDDVHVLGNLCSTGQLLQPYGDYKESQFVETFTEQAGYLAEAGADGFLIETMFDLAETLCAVQACRRFDLPVLASVAFSTAAKGGRTSMGNSARDCAWKLVDAGADVVGVNCGSIDHFEAAEIVASMKAVVSVPILAQPNAGIPELIEGKTVFSASPYDFSDGIRECIHAGATWVGGCCGTTPEHIRAVAAAVSSQLSAVSRQQ
jgi:5-methyltetrahydrofolate--homocysteine methyltransferase